MGLDISFNRDLAIDAGLQLTTQANGTHEMIARARANGREPEYIDYLESISEYIKVPGTDFSVNVGGRDYDLILVRANKWGRVYEPLTNWLTQHGITWTEA